MFISAVLQAVKKGPNARGGLVWKTHAFWKVSKTRKANVRKKLLALNAVRGDARGGGRARGEVHPRRSAQAPLTRDARRARVTAAAASAGVG